MILAKLRLLRFQEEYLFQNIPMQCFLKSTFYLQTIQHNLLQSMSSTRSRMVPQMVKLDKSLLQLEFVQIILWGHLWTCLWAR